MDVFKAQFERIQQQLAGLNASQKMLTAALVIIMVMTLVLWGRFAGTAEMAPVLDQSLSAEEIAEMSSLLRARGFDYRIEGGKILVPADQQVKAWTELSYASKMPSDFQAGLDSLVKGMSPWTSPSTANQVFIGHRQGMLSKVMQGWKDVDSAFVLLPQPEERRIGVAMEATASVSMTLRKGVPVTDDIVNSVRDFVSRSTRGLARKNVSVVINSKPYPDTEGVNDAATSADRLLARVRESEEYHTGKVRSLFSHIPGLMVSVSVNIDQVSEQEQSTAYNKDTTLQIENKTDTRSRASDTPQGPSSTEEVGALANTSVSTGQSGASGTSATETEDESKSEFTVLPGSTVISKSRPPGDVEVVSASVMIPYSHYVQGYKSRSKSTDDPTEETLQPVIDKDLAVLRGMVKNCLNVPNDGAISVATYSDTMPTATAEPVTTAGTMTSMLGEHSKEIAIGALAVISLFMVSMMVRKGGVISSSSPVMNLAADIKPVSQLPTGDDLVGEVTEGGTMLDGMELDEDAVKTQQMLTQVSDLVDENPDAAANLVKRWLNRD